MDPHYVMNVCVAIRAAYYYTKIYYISYTLPFYKQLMELPILLLME